MTLHLLGYLDPGTGSIVIQSIIAGIIGFFVAVKLFWFRIVGFFKKRKPASSTNTSHQVKS